MPTQLSSHRLIPPIALGCLMAAFAQLLYTFTLAPTILWGDAANFQRMAYALDFDAPHAYDEHRLWVLIAHVFVQSVQVGEIAYRVNLFTSLWASAAVGLMAMTVYRLTGSSWAGGCAGLALMVSHNFWIHAVRTEVYSFNLFLLTLSIFCFATERATPGRFLLALFAIGVAIANHAMMLLAIPTLAVLLWPHLLQNRTRWNRWLSIYAGAIVMAGILFFWFLDRFITVADIPNFARYMPVWHRIPNDAARFTLYWVLQFPSIALALTVWGFITSRKRPAWGLALVLLWAGSFFALLNVDFADKYVFYMFSFVAGAYWVGFGAAELSAWCKRYSLNFQRAIYVVVAAMIFLLPVAAYALAPTWLPVMGITAERLGIREVPNRPALLYFLQPWSHTYTGARDYADSVLATVEPDALLLSDYTLAQPITYLQVVEAKRPDIQVLLLNREEQAPFALANYTQSPLYLAHTDLYYDFSGLQEHFEIEQVGVVYRLSRNSNASVAR